MINTALFKQGRCLLCSSYDHSETTGHTDKELIAWMDYEREQIASSKRIALNNAYKLVAKDISKRPRNIIRLIKQLKG